MKLKYLFNNEDLALMCLKQWHYDNDSTDLFKYYRISSNAIYPFKHEGKLLYLRFSPKEEKALKYIQSEVQLVETLRQSNIPVPKIILSKNNLPIETITSPWGIYYAVVWEGIVSDRGITLEDGLIDDDMIYKLGIQLGRIHSSLNHLTQETCNRPSFEDHLTAIKHFFEKDEAYKPYLERAKTLSSSLSKLPKSMTHYGLLHYDYELDNLILNKYDQNIYTLDFDDACYGWYDLDIMIAINNILEESTYESYNDVETLFLKGYQSTKEYTPLSESDKMTLITFESLYKYARIMRAVEENWQNEPEWMIDIRSKLTYSTDLLTHKLFR